MPMSGDDALPPTSRLRRLAGGYRNALADCDRIPMISASDYLATTFGMLRWELAVIASIFLVPLIVVLALALRLAGFSGVRREGSPAAVLLAKLAVVPRYALRPLAYVWAGRFELRILHARYLTRWLFYLRTRRRLHEVKQAMLRARVTSFVDGADERALGELEACERRIDEFAAYLRPSVPLLAIAGFATSTIGPAAIAKLLFAQLSPEATQYLRALQSSPSLMHDVVATHLDVVEPVEYAIGFIAAGIVSVCVDLRKIMLANRVYEAEDASGFFDVPAEAAETPWDLIAVAVGSLLVFVAEWAKFSVLVDYDPANVTAPIVIAGLALVMMWRRRAAARDGGMPRFLRRLVAGWSLHWPLRSPARQ
jgi:hypothetical protein